MRYVREVEKGRLRHETNTLGSRPGKILNEWYACTMCANSIGRTRNHLHRNHYQVPLMILPLHRGQAAQYQQDRPK